MPPDPHDEDRGAPEGIEIGFGEEPDAELDQPNPRELAEAAAAALLDGPGLVPPDPLPSPSDLEAAWGDDALDGVERLRADLGGRRVGLAISGGGSLGSFEAGVLRFAYDHAAIAPVAIAGNSAGGLNGEWSRAIVRSRAIDDRADLAPHQRRHVGA
ncbi:MAG: hypothetical protein R2702_14000 [Acidimicrobiales bacterium]